MSNLDTCFQQSQSFLPLESSIVTEQSLKKLKKQKNSKIVKGKSILYEELKKINSQSTQKKRECVIKYLKKEEQLKNNSELIQTIEKEGHAIPILQIAIALSRYDNQFLKQLLDSKTIEFKENKESQIYQLSKSINSDPILSLLSDSQQLKRLPPPQKQPSFLEFKQKSPQKKQGITKLGKGNAAKPKLQCHSMIEYPKQLKQLKKQLLSLPYISSYKKSLSLKKHRQQDYECDSDLQIKHITDLNNSSHESMRNSTTRYENDVMLKNTLKEALEKRVKSFQISVKDIQLPKLQASFKNSISKQIRNQNTNSYDLIQQISKNSQFKRINTLNQSNLNPEEQYLNGQSTLKQVRDKNRHQQRKYWPEYRKYSPHNNKKYQSQIQNLRLKIKSFTQISQIPSQQTLQVFYSLKKLQNNDLKKLQKQSLKQEKSFSNTKYKIKFKNLKQNYSKRLKQFIKDRKMRQFQLQNHAYQQKSNLTINEVKLNRKMLQKLSTSRKQQK